MALTPLPPVPQLDRQIEALKWLAMLTMLIDHVGLLFFKDTAWYFPMRGIGRLCLPMIMWIAAVRLTAYPGRERGYLKRLIIWGVISQVPYGLAFLIPNQRDMFYMINIMATLALGVMILMLLKNLEQHSTLRKLAHMIGILVLLSLGHKVDYGPAAVAMLPAAVLLMNRSPRDAAIAVGLISCIAGLMSTYTLDRMHILVFTITPLLAIPLILWLPQRYANAKRMPGWAFYAFYPAHITLLIAILLLVYAHLQ